MTKVFTLDDERRARRKPTELEIALEAAEAIRKGAEVTSSDITAGEFLRGVSVGEGAARQCMVQAMQRVGLMFNVIGAVLAAYDAEKGKGPNNG